MLCFFFFVKQKTAYVMRISDWSSDLCSSDLASQLLRTSKWTKYPVLPTLERAMRVSVTEAKGQLTELVRRAEAGDEVILTRHGHAAVRLVPVRVPSDRRSRRRSEEHTAELQSHMRTSYAAFCLKKKSPIHTNTRH